jgi:acyl-CoA reductase-like NAD-dependent aldehyde dehydrogenase
LREAAAAGRAVVLLSAADAGIYAGAGWFKAVIDAARAAAPTPDYSAVLDCGGDAGAAQAALRAGIAAIVFTGRPDVAERLTAIAAATGARVLTARPAADLDLLAEFFSDAATLRRRCKAVFDIRA